MVSLFVWQWDNYGTLMMTSENRPMSEEQELLRAKLNTETAKIQWQELQRHFARGVVIYVEVGVDLIDVALTIANDDKVQLESWMGEGKVVRADESHARDWQQRDPLLWSVVVAPWVLVQESVTVN